VIAHRAEEDDVVDRAVRKAKIGNEKGLRFDAARIVGNAKGKEFSDAARAHGVGREIGFAIVHARAAIVVGTGGDGELHGRNLTAGARKQNSFCKGVFSALARENPRADIAVLIAPTVSAL